MHRIALLATATLGALAAPWPLLPVAAEAAEATQPCPARPLPHQLRRLSASFDDRGNADQADDVLVVELGLCGEASPRSSYQVSFDVRPPLLSDADRNGDGQVNRKDLCVDTRDAFALRYAGPLPRPLPGRRIGTTELVRHAAGDTVRFTVAIDDVAASLPRGSGTVVNLWAETRLLGATLAAPPVFDRHRLLADRLPPPDATDGCALPQTQAEVLAVPLAGAPSGPGPNLQICICADETELRLCAQVDCDSGPAQDAICGPACASHGGEAATGCLFADPVCAP